jgi:uncharacterized protein YdhG (YjbR/CyaY superfamily)
MAQSESVDSYIAKCPRSAQAKLEEIRAAIREAAPGAVETMSYFEIPGFSYPGYDYNGMFAWFSFKGSQISLHLRPPTIEDHQKQLAGYPKTKSIVRFPIDKDMPIPLVKRLVRSSVQAMKAKGKSGGRPKRSI